MVTAFEEGCVMIRFGENKVNILIIFPSWRFDTKIQVKTPRTTSLISSGEMLVFEDRYQLLLLATSSLSKLIL